jgi:tRNA(Ile2) C34 agmatinyltransferase TiaS
MDLLVCPSCGRRSAVSGAGPLGEWKCARCDQELAVVNRGVPRLAVMGDVLPGPGLGVPTRGAVTHGSGPPGFRPPAGRAA